MSGVRQPRIQSSCTSEAILHPEWSHFIECDIIHGLLHILSHGQFTLEG